MKKHILPLFWCFIIFSSSVKPAREEVKLLNLKAVSSLKQQKPLFNDLYADWFYGCKVMDKKTYDDQKQIDYRGKKRFSILTSEVMFPVSIRAFISQEVPGLVLKHW